MVSRTKGVSMSKKMNNEKSKERIDESNIDWSQFSDFDDALWDSYQDALKKGIPPELERISTTEELLAYFCGE